MTDPTGGTFVLKGALSAGQALAKNKKWLAKLLNQPDTAAPQLAAALAEFRRSVEAIREVLLRLWYLAGRAPTDPDLRDSLVRIRDGQLLGDVAAAKGRCSTIGRIYDTYLDGWISKVIGSKQAVEFTYIFNELRSSDDRVTRALEDVSAEAQRIAEHSVKLLETGRSADAMAALKQFADAYRPRIREVNELVAWMIEQENTFLDRARIA
jgi:hypothetical protein